MLDPTTCGYLYLFFAAITLAIVPDCDSASAMAWPIVWVLGFVLLILKMVKKL